MKMIVIVGNSKLSHNYSHMVDNADTVIRFNIPSTYGSESGTKFDIWSIANSAGGKKFVESQVFKNAEYKLKPSQLWIPRDVSVHKELRKRHSDSDTLLSPATEIDYTDEIVSSNDLENLQIVRFPSNIYWECLEVLRSSTSTHTNVKIPSTGFLTIYYVLKMFSQHSVTLIGFSFEGWEGHPWQLENKIIKQWANQGLLTHIN